MLYFCPSAYHKCKIKINALNLSLACIILGFYHSRNISLYVTWNMVKIS